MKHLVPFLLLSLLIIFSCKKESKFNDVKKTGLDTIQQADKKNSFNTNVKLRAEVKKELKNWKEYQLVDAMLSRYFTFSNSEALSNAEELSNLVTHLKDSISDERLKTPPILARINILHNECLRLNDMSSITAISKEEVSLEITNILEAFAAINAKLNSAFKVKDIEEELELDPDFEKILNDSTSVPASNIDSPSTIKNPKNKRLKNKIEDKLRKKPRIRNNNIK